MSNPELWQQYQVILKQADFIVTYSALPDEIAVEETPLFEMVKDKPKFVVPPTHKIEPKEVANQINRFIENYPLSPSEALAKEGHATSYSLVIFLPGQKFDLTGTRKGRGYGWYDRLLAELPTDWVRIGIANEIQIRKTPIERNSWDQPVDWLIWRNQNSWDICKTEAKKIRTVMSGVTST